MQCKTIIIIPTYNEKENLPSLAARIRELPVKTGVLVVDDNSPDGTGRIADELAEGNEDFHVLHKPRKEGLGRAYCEGFKWALERDYEYIFDSGDGVTNYQYLITVLGADGTNRLQIYAGGTLLMNIPKTDANLPNWFVKDEWTMLTLTVDSSGSNILYVNGFYFLGTSFVVVLHSVFNHV